jgi:hypothetical protein
MKSVRVRLMRKDDPEPTERVSAGVPRRGPACRHSGVTPTRQELAADLGVFGAVVSQWEADETLPNIEQFRGITELCAAKWLREAVRNGDVLIGQR